jgi:hypothetical protein
MVEHLSQTKVAQQSVTQILSLTFTNLVTPKAGGKNEHLSRNVLLHGFPNLLPAMEHHAIKNVNNCWNTNKSSYFLTSGGQNSNLYLNVVHIFNASVN